MRELWIALYWLWWFFYCKSLSIPTCSPIFTNYAEYILFLFFRNGHSDLLYLPVVFLSKGINVMTITFTMLIINNGTKKEWQWRWLLLCYSYHKHNFEYETIFTGETSFLLQRRLNTEYIVKGYVRVNICYCEICCLMLYVMVYVYGWVYRKGRRQCSIL